MTTGYSVRVFFSEAVEVAFVACPLLVQFHFQLRRQEGPQEGPVRPQ